MKPNWEDSRIVMSCVQTMTNANQISAWIFWSEKLNSTSRDSVIAMIIASESAWLRNEIAWNLAQEVWPPNIKRRIVEVDRR